MQQRVLHQPCSADGAAAAGGNIMLTRASSAQAVHCVSAVMAARPCCGQRLGCACELGSTPVCKSSAQVLSRDGVRRGVQCVRPACRQAHQQASFKGAGFIAATGRLVPSAGALLAAAARLQLVAACRTGCTNVSCSSLWSWQNVSQQRTRGTACLHGPVQQQD